MGGENHIYQIYTVYTAQCKINVGYPVYISILYTRDPWDSTKYPGYAIINAYTGYTWYTRGRGEN